MNEEIARGLAAVLTIKHNLGHKGELRTDIENLLVSVHQEAFEQGLDEAIKKTVQEAKPKKVKKAKDE